MISTRFFKKRVLKNIYTIGLVLLTIFILLSFAKTSNRIADFGTCRAPFESGNWLNDPNDSKLWAPQSCVLKRFEQKDLQKCYKDHQVIFIGDYSIKSKYQNFISRLENKYVNTTKKVDMLNLNAIEAKTLDSIDLKYHYDPFLNGTEITAILKYLKNAKRANTIKGKKSLTDNNIMKKFEERKKYILILGVGDFYLNNTFDSNEILKWKKTIDNIIDIYASTQNSISSPIKLVISPIIPVTRNHLLTAKYDSKYFSTINGMNIYLKKYNKVIFIPLSWANMIHSDINTFGINSGYNFDLESYLMDILHNQNCNKLKDIQQYPFMHYCCSNYPFPSIFAFLLILMLFVFVPTVFMLKKYTVVIFGCVVTYMTLSKKYMLTRIFESFNTELTKNINTNNKNSGGINKNETTEANSSNTRETLLNNFFDQTNNDTSTTNITSVASVSTDILETTIITKNHVLKFSVILILCIIINMLFY
ncbi:hypothetical protein BB561_006182 [Smittium simulii]|uniref:Cas1p 10 TM acyl transferase domain-containing protein n=1 Tax=Smittium simulii TaxID=133385 RepID=A0A2T9Y620_9FUNG|nr:hypothetical protein BB561_006182 [Smittium simulii]